MKKFIHGINYRQIIFLSSVLTSKKKKKRRVQIVRQILKVKRAPFYQLD